MPTTSLHNPERIDNKVYKLTDNKTVSIKDLLETFVRHGVSRVTDLHLKTGLPPTYRVDGDLKVTNGRPLDLETAEALAKTILDDLEWGTLQQVRSFNCSHLVGEKRYRFNIYYDRCGMSMAIRALDTKTPTIEMVGFPNGVWEDIVKLRSGLVLLTGATGSGKSTTIAALLDRIAQTRACHIITLEDPIEYQLESKTAIISQRAIGRDVPSYERGLRDCLREDPDVIFVGEMTDQEAANWTLTAAETGHLVFSALHTRDTPGTVTRLLDMYPSSRVDEVANQLSLGLRYIISQKLIQRAEGYGRVVAMEIFNNNFAMANLIRQVKPEQMLSVLQTHARDTTDQRMIAMERHLVELVRAGVVSQHEAERAANHPQMFMDEMKR
jgi:twitching motility protein PilT